MKKASDQILETLKTRGYRVTGARREVLRTLANAREPLTIQAVAARADADEASVYRTIDLLRNERLINEIPVEGSRPRFEISSHHHHHAVCQQCGRVEHLPCGDEPRPPRHIPGFSSIEDHELIFYGQCVDCV